MLFPEFTILITDPRGRLVPYGNGGTTAKRSEGD